MLRRCQIQGRGHQSVQVGEGGPEEVYADNSEVGSKTVVESGDLLFALAMSFAHNLPEEQKQTPNFRQDFNQNADGIA